MHRTSRPVLAILAASALLAACGGSDTKVTTPTEEHVHVNFKAVVGPSLFTCGPTYTGLGAAANQSWTPKDFRLYVHDVRFVTAAGVEVEAHLEEDGTWQRAGVALLDFEDASGACAGGTASLNTELHAHVPVGTYTGLKFRLGVPESLNHLDVAAVAAPLDVTAMYWNWTGGYKFVKIDGNTTGQPGGINFHLGSTGCTAATAGDFSTVTCTTPNRPEVSLTGFDHATSTVVIDAAALFAGADLDVNTAASAPGCMSGPTDPECAPLFRTIGLPFGAAAAEPQTVFSVE